MIIDQSICLICPICGNDELELFLEEIEIPVEVVDEESLEIRWDELQSRAEEAVLICKECSHKRILPNFINYLQN